MNDFQTLRICPGKPLPLGSTITAEGVNFSVFSRHATSVTLVLFQDGVSDPVAELVLDPRNNRTGDIWHIQVDIQGGGGHERLRYAYRADGPYDPDGKGHRFEKEKLLLDPYARVIVGTEKWRAPTTHRLCALQQDRFDWQGDMPLRIPLQDTVIYELHTRGYTVHPSSGTRHPGTFKALVEKLPYIKSLGVTAVELLPLFEFDEMEKKPINPVTGQRLHNFWGYGAYSFFAPRAAYAADPKNGNQVTEFKEMVKTFHREGIEVFLDVVFNHTAERDAQGPTISFRGLDNAIYYSLNPETRAYVNVSGCGNTFNCNHPVVRAFVIDCLRYWVLDMHVDGFRFDLATILGRDHKGDLMAGPSLIDDIEKDPVLADTKMIAEAWDMGAHLVGSFPGRWIEWNSFFRDDVRRFVRGDRGMVSSLATRIAGSSDLFCKKGRSPLNSINFVTCHDGFTLNDLVSYDKKHNEENGEGNRDGTDHNASSNCGVEGPTEDAAVLSLRQRRVKTLLTLLMTSQGVPMVPAGDEFGRTQDGNNNAYCQDSPLSWIDWSLTEKNKDLLRFFRMLVALRNRHPVFRRSTFLTGSAKEKEDWPDISWHGTDFNKPDWSEGSRTLAYLLNGTQLAPITDDNGHFRHISENSPDHRGEKNGIRDNDFFVIFNADDKEHVFRLPEMKSGTRWIRIVDTGKASPADILYEEEAEAIKDPKYRLTASSAAVFMAKNE